MDESIDPETRAQVETQFGAELEAIFMRVQMKINRTTAMKKRIVEEFEAIISKERYDIQDLEEGEDLRKRLAEMNMFATESTKQLRLPQAQMEECWQQAYEDLEQLSIYYKNTIFPKLKYSIDKIIAMNELLDVMLLHTQKSHDLEKMKNIRLSGFLQKIQSERVLGKLEVINEIEEFRDVVLFLYQKPEGIPDSEWPEDPWHQSFSKSITSLVHPGRQNKRTQDFQNKTRKTWQ